MPPALIGQPPREPRPRACPSGQEAIIKAYLLTTTILFGLLAIMHALRVVSEGAHVGHDPWFLLITLTAAGRCVWSAVLLRRLSRSGT